MATLLQPYCVWKAEGGAYGDLMPGPGYSGARGNSQHLTYLLSVTCLEVLSSEGACPLCSAWTGLDALAPILLVIVMMMMMMMP